MQFTKMIQETAKYFRRTFPSHRRPSYPPPAPPSSVPHRPSPATPPRARASFLILPASRRAASALPLIVPARLRLDSPSHSRKTPAAAKRNRALRDRIPSPPTPAPRFLSSTAIPFLTVISASLSQRPTSRQPSSHPRRAFHPATAAADQQRSPQRDSSADCRSSKLFSRPAQTVFPRALASQPSPVEVSSVDPARLAALRLRAQISLPTTKRPSPTPRLRRKYAHLDRQNVQNAA